MSGSRYWIERQSSRCALPMAYIRLVKLVLGGVQLTVPVRYRDCRDEAPLQPLTS